MRRDVWTDQVSVKTIGHRPPQFKDEDKEVPVSEEQIANSELEGDDEYEEICSNEVDRTIALLEAMMETVESENIHTYLEEAAGSIHALIYDESETETADDGDVLGEAA